MREIKTRIGLAATVGTTILVVLGLCWAVRLIARPDGPRGEDPTEPLQSGSLADRRALETVIRHAESESSDLLDSVSALSDALGGDWGFQGRALITGAVPQGGRLQLPCLPPAEYDLKLTVTRKQGVDALYIGLIVSDVQTLLTLDDAASRSSWISLAGRSSPEVNETAVFGKLLKWNKPTILEISVRKDRVSVTVEHRKVLDWKGNPNELTVEPTLLVPNPRALSIGSKNTVFRVDEFRLTPRSGKPTFLR